MNAELERRRNRPPFAKAHSIAFGIVTNHPDVFLDDTPLDDLIADIAQAILAGVDGSELPSEER